MLRTAALRAAVFPAGAADSAPPPCLTQERVAVARWARRQTKAIDESFYGSLKKKLNRSHVRSMSGQSSKSSYFALSSTEAELITSDNPNSAKRLCTG